MFSRSGSSMLWKRIAVLILEILYGKPKSNNVSTICDGDSLEKIKEALRPAELIVGFDFTKTNEHTGRISFDGNNLHQIRDGIPNPYEDIISILGRGTQSPFDKDMPVSCFGFGDSTTRDESVFSFNSENKPCLGFDEALLRYRQIVPDLRLAEHKTFAPIIEKAISITKMNQGKQHVLVIISNGPGKLALQRLVDILQKRLCELETQPYGRNVYNLVKKILPNFTRNNRCMGMI